MYDDKTEDCLFVGGPWDGQWFAIEGRPNIMQAQETVGNYDRYCEGPGYSELIEMKIVQYRRRQMFRGIVVYVIDGLSVDEAWVKVLKGYRQPRGIAR